MMSFIADMSTASYRVGRPIIVALTMAQLLSGCAQTQQKPVSNVEVENFTKQYPAPLQPLFRQVPIQGQRNLVLNYMRSGLAALDAGQLDVARQSFDTVIERVDAIYADTASAEQARSIWYKESAKDFIGEPYERAMAFYYRGVIDLMNGDYNNARASFAGGIRQDTYMEGNQRMEATFGSLSYLEGWSARCAKMDIGTINESFTIAKNLNSGLAEPASDDNLLVIAETGSAPIKQARGAHHEILAYGPGLIPPLSGVTINYGKISKAGIPAEDIYYEASTRSGRHVDAINEGKVVYHDTTATVGNVAAGAGLGMLAASSQMQGRQAGNMAMAGGITLLAGFAAQAVSASMQTEADWRQWDNLPGNLLVATFPQLGASVDVTFARISPPDIRQVVVHKSGACSIAWVHEIPANHIPDTAPDTEASTH